MNKESVEMAMALYTFDGTLDDDRAVGTDQAAVAKETNVWKFYSAYDGYTKPRGISNVYVPGVSHTKPGFEASIRISAAETRTWA
ncbi:MAG TPA: hypothetical protein VGY48_00170 [Vicinamibacterales bacterium]|jgi:hypothetical protein|nr:hypothetical protein [Vicinamibacterales bacterium]